jgi:hypothetical protein
MFTDLLSDIDSLKNSTHDSFMGQQIVQSLEQSKSAIRLLIKGDMNFLYIHRPEINQVSIVI